MHRRSRTLLAALAAAALVPLAGRAADRDGDGLDDALEDALLARHAPIVLLHPSEPALPSSVEWLLARAEVEPATGRPRVLAASVIGALATALDPSETPRDRLRPEAAALAGTGDPGAWTVYGHAAPAEGGGVVLQYWFFYPMNAGYGVLDHEGDWEHVTVRLDAALRPAGVDYARHLDAMPGQAFGWGELAREGDHPVVLSARGTHASYASRDDAPFWDRVCPASDPRAAEAAGCKVWRTWTGGGVTNVGERDAPRVPFLAWPGRWGATGRFGFESASGPPRGPAFQPGWCSGIDPARCRADP
jgi:hypothetical protein